MPLNRFKPDAIKELLDIKWWGWPRPRIEAALSLLSQPDINPFINAVKEGKL